MKKNKFKKGIKIENYKNNNKNVYSNKNKEKIQNNCEMVEHEHYKQEKKNNKGINKSYINKK